MKNSTFTTLVLALLLPLQAFGQAAAEKYQKYPSKYKKRGDVHGVVVSLPYPNVYASIIKAFNDLGLTINYEEPTLGYLEGGRSRGVAAEIVRLWIDPEEKGQYRVEVRNIRISRMGLIGLSMTKDWSLEVLDAVYKDLSSQPKIEQLRSAVAASPSSIEAHRKLIEALIANNQSSEAAEIYRNLLSQHPNSTLDRMKCADLLQANGQSEQAIELLRQAETSDPEIAFGLARIYVQMNRSDEAMKLLKMLAQQNPADLKTQFQLARAALLSGQLEEAKQDFNWVIEKSPQHPFAEQSKAWLKLAEGGAIKNPIEARAALALSELLEKEGLTVLAQQYLEALPATTSAAEKAQAQRRLAKIYQLNRQFEAITKLLASQAEQFKKEKQGDLLYALCLAHCGLRKFDAALEYLKLAQKAGQQVPKELEQALKLYKS